MRLGRAGSYQGDRKPFPFSSGIWLAGDYARPAEMRRFPHDYVLEEPTVRYRPAPTSTTAADRAPAAGAGVPHRHCPGTSAPPRRPASDHRRRPQPSGESKTKTNTKTESKPRPTPRNRKTASSTMSKVCEVSPSRWSCCFTRVRRTWPAASWASTCSSSSRFPLSPACCS